MRVIFTLKRGNIGSQRHDNKPLVLRNNNAALVALSQKNKDYGVTYSSERD